MLANTVSRPSCKRCVDKPIILIDNILLVPSTWIKLLRILEISIFILVEMCSLHQQPSFLKFNIFQLEILFDFSNDWTERRVPHSHNFINESSHFDELGQI